jgi:uncharacterized protein (DUF58 family)
VSVPIGASLDWGALLPLRLRAPGVALGALTGAHRSLRRGAGVEFAGHRAYTPGDDLRFLDRHALMRHGTLALREFETETDRSVQLVLDATASMGFRGGRAPSAKLAFTALIAAALGYVVLRGGDRVALDWIGGNAPSLPVRGGRHTFEALVATLETVTPSGQVTFEGLRSALGRAARAKTGSVSVLVSDLLDFPDGAAEEVAALAAGGRPLLVVQVLDPDERDLPFDGPVRLRSLEGDLTVDTDATNVRSAYLAALARLQDRWAAALAARGSRLVLASSADDAVDVVRRSLAVLAGNGV